MFSALYLLALPFALFAYLWTMRRKRNILLPPSPPSEPILGHLRTFPRIDQDQAFYELSKVYGDVMHFNVLGKSVIILSSTEAATDLLDKRSANYSDRPAFPAFELLGWGRTLVFTPYGSSFHVQRKLLTQPFTRQGCAMFQPIQLQQAHILLQNLVHSPEDYESHIRRYTAAIIMQITYGHRVQSDDDRYVKLAEQVNDTILAMGRAAILDLLPFLKHLPPWFPGAWFIRYARDTQPMRDEMENEPFEEVRRQMSAGTAQLSFTSMHLEELAREGNNSEEDINLLKIASMHMWTAGAETTWGTILIFIFAILLHPEAQKRAQREIEEVIGSSRLPDFDDRDSLPYLECLLQESRRWHPTISLGVPHRSMADDVYRGMLIPKGATIIANARALSLDENVYPNPHSFWPERFLPENGQPHPTSAMFGFGRRVCAGKNLADASVWIVAATILASFDITMVKDEHGKDLPPKVEFTRGLTSHPVPFKCNICPRTKQVEHLIDQLPV